MENTPTENYAWFRHTWRINNGILLYVQEENPEEWPLCIEATLTSGRIALQSEGGPIEFRNIHLVPLGE